MAIEVAYMVAAAHAAVKAQVARINDLNVYPVPDGDTGTNMLLTLASALNETSGKSYGSPQEASRACARAALMGARGNSGVILSQMIRGACEVLADRRSLDAGAFAAGLEGARERAYASVREPVEGTMLTVIKDAALAAREAVEGGDADLPSVVRAAREAAHDSVRRTPELLAVLREAGVVDAGGLGVAVVLERGESSVFSHGCVRGWCSGAVFVGVSVLFADALRRRRRRRSGRRGLDRTWAVLGWARRVGRGAGEGESKREDQQSPSLELESCCHGRALTELWARHQRGRCCYSKRACCVFGSWPTAPLPGAVSGLVSSRPGSCERRPVTRTSSPPSSVNRRTRR